LADGLGLAGLGAVAVAQGTSAQMGVQFGQVVNLGHGRGPVLLQELDTALDARLLLGPTHQAEQRLEQVVAGQRLVAVVELPIAADENVRRHGPGIVPPQFVRHATKESEGFNQAVQDRFGAFGGQCQGEGAIGVAPGDEQNRHELAALGEIHIDVAEVRFETLARIMVERDERLAGARTLAPNVESYALRAAAIAVLIAEAAKDPGGRVPLLARCVGIGAKDVADDGLERIEDRGRGLGTGVRSRLGVAEDLANLATGVMELACQFTDAEFFDNMRPADTCVLVHLDHPSPPCSWPPKRCTSLQEESWGGPELDEDLVRRWARIG
jgi:hypothetical protein